MISTRLGWYEQRCPGLGYRFMGAVSETVDAIAGIPPQFAVRHRNIRRARVRGFPYGLFFITETERTVVIACFHASRDPASWQLRGDS